MGRFGTAFARLSKRERMLVLGMFGSLFVAGVVILHLVMQSKITKLEEDVSAEQEALRVIYRASDDYLAAKSRFEATRKRAAAAGEVNLPTAIAGLSDEVTFEGVDPRNNPLGLKKLKEYLEFKPLREKVAGPHKKKTAPRKDTGDKKDAADKGAKDKKDAADKKEASEGYYQRDQEISVKEGVPFKAVYEFLEKLERSHDLLFVTELKLDRSRNDPERAALGKIVVSTYYYQSDTAASE